MPAPVVTAELVLNAIKARLDLITGANYNTAPTVAVRVPRDAVTEGKAERLYLAHSSSETIHDAAMSQHVERATYTVWCVSTDSTETGMRKAMRLVRDAQKAVRSGFSAIEAAGANAGVALTGYARDERAEEITGATAYSFGITADWIVDLTV